MTSIADALKGRISTRAFLDKPVSKDILTSLLEVARYAPSGGNLQPWRVVAVTGEAKAHVTKIAQEALVRTGFQGEPTDDPIYPKDLQDPYRSRRYKVGEDMYALLGIPRDDKPARLQWVANNYEFFGAPVGLFFFIDPVMGRGQWAHLGMFMQSVALAAYEQGLATCMQEAWAVVRPTLEAHFALEGSPLLYCGMALGYPDPDAPVNSLRSDRAAVEEFTRFDGF